MYRIIANAEKGGSRGARRAFVCYGFPIIFVLSITSEVQMCIHSWSRLNPVESLRKVSKGEVQLEGRKTYGQLNTGSNDLVERRQITGIEHLVFRHSDHRTRRIG